MSSITPVYFSYKNITLNLFLEIAETSEYKRLLISGTATDEQCQEQWEKIVAAHNVHNGNYQYANYLSHLKAFRALLRKSLTVGECLTYLHGAIDNDMIAWLNKEGFKIDTTHGQEAFEKSLAFCLNKSLVFNSKLKQKLNQLETFNAAVIEARQAYNEGGTGIEYRLAQLSFSLGFQVEADITLARYNEYVRMLNKQQHGAGTQRHYNGRGANGAPYNG